MKKFFYRVKKDDTLLSLSEKFSIPFSKIIADNDLKTEIAEGDILYLESIKTARVYTVTPIDAILNPPKIADEQKEKVLKENGVPYLFFGLKLYI